MHAISSYRGNRPTNTQTNAATNPRNKHTGPITIHCAAKLSAQCNYPADGQTDKGKHITSLAEVIMSTSRGFGAVLECNASY